jgi:D-alanine-D-alanine ligase
MSEPLIWVFIPYFNEDGLLDGDTFDHENTKAELAKAFNTLRLPWIWQPVVLGNLDEVVNQVARYRRRESAIVFNFCDGLDTDGAPGPSVVRALEAARIPFTGADSQFYEISSSKTVMKQLFLDSGVRTPPYEVLSTSGRIRGICKRLGSPVIVKPEFGAASVGISLSSRVYTDAEIAARRDEWNNGKLPRHSAPGSVFVERFIEGREFTVFVIGDWRYPNKIRCLTPTERVFSTEVPPDERFLSWERYWSDYREESEHTFFQYGAVTSRLGRELSDIAKRAYTAVRGVGYGRVDIRMESATGELHVLEVNGNPEVTEERHTATGSIL